MGARPATRAQQVRSDARSGVATTRTRPHTARPSHGARPAGGTRPYDTRRAAHSTPPHRTDDHRYARPHHHHVHHHPHAHYYVPGYWWYRPYYTRWYCHPYYRYAYSTSVVVHFGFGVYAWSDAWAPPHRYGWAWVPGYWSWGYWHPGYWQPAPVVVVPTGYRYVPGWWEDDSYVEGHYRAEERDEWEWIDGYYLEDGTHVRGHWVPTEAGPEGYVWEAGFFDGETWVEGFWRPEFRKAYRWLDSYFDADGIYHAGYWEPLEDEPGYVWVPGWFDGNEWIDGYWVLQEEYEQTNLDTWVPEEGWDDGWEVGSGWGDGEVEVNRTPDGSGEDAVLDEKAPLALPVQLPEKI